MQQYECIAKKHNDIRTQNNRKAPPFSLRGVTLLYRAACHGVSPGTRKDICIITAAVAAGMTGVNSFETTVSNEGGFTELRSDKAGAAICAPLCGTQHCFTGIKTVIHAPGFYEPARQALLNARFRAFVTFYCGNCAFRL